MHFSAASSGSTARAQSLGSLAALPQSVGARTRAFCIALCTLRSVSLHAGKIHDFFAVAILARSPLCAFATARSRSGFVFSLLGVSREGRHATPMEPTSEEKVTLESLREVLAWAEVHGDPEDAGTDAETLLAALHMSLATKPRLVAALTVEQENKHLQTWQPVGIESSAAQTGSAMTPATASDIETFAAAPVPEVSTTPIAKWSNTVSQTSERSAPALNRDAIGFYSVFCPSKNSKRCCSWGHSCERGIASSKGLRLNNL
eukprot:6367932-Amphidinium_carterae.5